MGVSDRVPLRLPLVEMYVPLKARIELPEGETWARDLRLAGREVSDEEAEAMGHRLSEPRPVLDLLREHDGLIILGDPGAGKTTFLKYLALRLAHGRGRGAGPGRPPAGAAAPVGLCQRPGASGTCPWTASSPSYYHDRGVDLPLGPHAGRGAGRGRALLLLDGLDEVRDLAQRHLVVERVVDFFAFHRRQGNKFVLTSRIVGYREVRPDGRGAGRVHAGRFRRRGDRRVCGQVDGGAGAGGAGRHGRWPPRRRSASGRSCWRPCSATRACAAWRPTRCC